MKTCRRSAVMTAFLFGLAFLPHARTQACLMDAGLSPNSPPGQYLFPNWRSAAVTYLDLIYCSQTDCNGYNNGSLVGLTIFNFGSAEGVTDIANMYFCIACYTDCTVPQYTLTYAGIWTIGSASRPVWTWSSGGPLTPLEFNANPCDDTASGKGCAVPCTATLKIFVDIAPCPTDKATIVLGPGYNYVSDLEPPGGITDEWTAANWCNAPWTELRDPAVKTIAYINKVADRQTAPPGDTITYRIYYGLPGTVPISTIQIIDSLPPYTHYVSGSAVPAPDTDWAPKVGPPQRLRWTIPGAPFTPGVGRTQELTFQLVVDWGNEPYDPESGQVAAPEGERLLNRGAIYYENASCAVQHYVSPAAETIVRRFLFWQEADNDLLFSASLGQDPDEITYTTFVKNVSTKKTWWEVSLWDTVPPELDSWAPNCGLYDPCVGFTMTPVGCSAANPGRLLSGGETILTWRFNMPPGFSISLQWKAQVRPTAPGESDTINIISLRALGYNGVDGTGDSKNPANFAHQAPIVLPTTYVSYTSFFGADKGNTACPGIFIPFFPLNKKTDFTLFGLEIIGAGTWAQYGGLSPPINNMIGSCTGGFTNYQPGGTAGCKAERAPAMYDPTVWHSNCPDFPFHFLYKVVSNSPFLWQMRTWVLNDNQDHHMYEPSNSRSFRGFIVYTYRLGAVMENPGLGTSYTIINTSTDAQLEFRPDLTTTVHVFKWATDHWTYVRSMDLGAESAGVILGTLKAEQGFYKIMSSQAHIIVHHGWNIFDSLSASGCCDNFGTMAPSRETGNLVSQVGKGNFYVIGNGWGSAMSGDTWTSFVIGNTGSATATYRIWQYIPNATSPAPCPIMLGGTSGIWNPVVLHTADAGLGPPGTHAYCGPFDRTGFVGPSTALFKVELLSGGPLQIRCGNFVPSVFGGGSILHAADGEQAGTEFWYHQTAHQNYSCGGSGDPMITPEGVFDIFCPKKGMVVNCVSSDNWPNPYYNYTFTTTGSDQVIAFMALSFMRESDPITKRNWIMSLPNPDQGSVIAIYNMCMASEKGYTNPFVRTGTHYVIVAPQVVYSGQKFWITVAVLDASNATETTYAGTSGFTSSDSLSVLEAQNLGNYTYVWDGTEFGTKIFAEVSFNNLGLQSLIAYDQDDGTITGLTRVIVVGADVKLTKEPPLQVAATGDTVQFRICWSNYSSASASGLTITDAIPKGTTYLQDNADAHLCGGTYGPLTGATVAFSTTNNLPGSFQQMPLTGTSLPVTWLRWTIPDIYVKTTGCACFKVLVQ